MLSPAENMPCTPPNAQVAALLLRQVRTTLVVPTTMFSPSTPGPHHRCSLALVVLLPPFASRIVTLCNLERVTRRGAPLARHLEHCFGPIPRRHFHARL